MNRSFRISLLVAATLAAAVVQAKPRESEPVFVAGSQYSAVLSQGNGSWRLLPLDGADVELRADGASCAASTTIARGVWIVSRDESGRLELVAPSSTTLAEGAPAHVALVACGDVDARSPAVVAPRVLVDWLANSAGAVYADE
ncbi:MAG TPA: hypothetical protein VFL14_05375 [Xanthomonadales bacterium]|nr:hypothetical protein [Xanthomonadales bacterium]